MQIIRGNIKYFFYKLIHRIASKKNILWKFCDVSRVALCGFHGFSSASAFKSRLQIMLGTYDNSLLNSISDENYMCIISSANQTLAHEFDLLGSGPIVLDPIDWHCDFKSNTHWDKQFYRDIERKKGADIKVPWELSRCQHLLWLGEAYLLAQDGKYAQEIVDEINWWIDDNPLMHSVNWTCSMDVAIRAVNWMYALNMISESDVFTYDFAHKVSISLYQHGFFIYNNLEKSIPWSNNHYMSDIVGLIYIGTLLNHTKYGRKWKQFAIKEFYKEARTQTLPSGVNYEKSISYHRLMLELISCSLTMLKRIGELIPKDIIQLTQRMYDYVGTYLKPNDKAPLIADNDDGRFLPFLCRDFRDHGYLLDAKELEHIIIYNGIVSMFDLRYNSSGETYEDAGIAILKEYGTYLLVNNSGYSKIVDLSKRVIGTHTHNDQLSFEFSIGEDDIFIDPGTYLYTSSILDRNNFRSTRKHNTIIVDGEEQNLLSDSNAFTININNKNRILRVDNRNCCGSYETIRGGLKHERRFEIKKGCLIITDNLYKQGDGHRGELFLHLAEQVAPKIYKDNSIKLTSQIYEFDIQIVRNDINERLETTINDDTWSPSYGILRPTKQIVSNFHFNKECSITTMITWKKK